MTKRKNRLEASAKRLGINCLFEKRYDGWYMVPQDGIQEDKWLGWTIADALVEFEATHDADSESEYKQAPQIT